MKVIKDHPLVRKIVYTYPNGNTTATDPFDGWQHIAIVTEIIDNGVAGTIAFRETKTNKLHSYNDEIGWRFNVNIEDLKVADDQIAYQWEVWKYKKFGKFLCDNQ